jgi:hypothetical protein
MALLPDTTFISSGRGGQASQKCGFGAVPYDEKAMAPSNESGGAGEARICLPNDRGSARCVPSFTLVCVLVPLALGGRAVARLFPNCPIRSSTEARPPSH